MTELQAIEGKIRNLQAHLAKGQDVRAKANTDDDRDWADGYCRYTEQRLAHLRDLAVAIGRRAS